MGNAQVWCSLTDYGDTTHLRRTPEFQFSSPRLGVCWRFAGIGRSLDYRLGFRQRKADAYVALCGDHFPSRGTTSEGAHVESEQGRAKDRFDDPIRTLVEHPHRSL